MASTCVGDDLLFFTIIDLAKKILDLTGSASKIVYRPLPHDEFQPILSE